MFGFGKKVNYSKMIVVLVLLTLTTTLVVGSTWFFTGLATTSMARTNQAHIATLETQLIELREAVKIQEAVRDQAIPLGTTTVTE